MPFASVALWTTVAVAAAVQALHPSRNSSLFHGHEHGRSLHPTEDASMWERAEREETGRLAEVLFGGGGGGGGGWGPLPLRLHEAAGVSRRCRRQSRIWAAALARFEMWALKMYDASAKVPSGLLNGNVNQLGDFDMCLSASSGRLDEGEGDADVVSGKYCLPSAEWHLPRAPRLAAAHELLHSHYHFRSRLEDPGHRVPRFSSISFAVCVPAACGPRDVLLGLRHQLATPLNATGLQLRFRLDPHMCQVDSREPLPLSSLLAILIFAALFLFEIFATIYECCTCTHENENSNKFLTAFSLKANWEKVVRVERSSGDIEAAHGVRMLNAVLLLLAHKSMAVFFLPIANRTDYVEYISRPFTVVGRAASLYTDPFIMISGMLTAHSLVAKLDRHGGGWDAALARLVGREYLSRLFRILPALAALVAFCTLALPHLAAGPLWPQVVAHHAHLCRTHFWRNLLFIHNYYGFQDMCLTHTHHIGIDTQLFLISPLLVYALWRWPKWGSVLLATLAVLSTAARYYVTYTMQLSNYIHFGTSVQQLFATADHMYILPAHRLTVYAMGVGLGYALRRADSSVVGISKAQLRVGNAAALAAFLLAYLGPAFMGSLRYQYNPLHAASYAAFSPPLYVAAFAWIIYTTHLGLPGVLGRFLSLRAWRLWTKVSYSVYLTQFSVYFYNVGVARSSSPVGFFSAMLNLQEYSWVLALSLLLTLAVELPFQNLRQLMLADPHTAHHKVS